MPVIEAQCASILVPHDHRHINQKRKFPEALACCPKPGMCGLALEYGLAVWVGLGVLARPRRMPGCRDHRQLVAEGLPLGSNLVHRSQPGGKVIWAGLRAAAAVQELPRSSGGCHRASLMIKRGEAAAAVRP